MNRKQVDFDFRVYPVGQGDGNYNHQMLSDEIRTQYIANGWEVISTEVTQVSANVLFLAVSLVKYENEVSNSGTKAQVLGTPVSKEK